MGEHAMSLEPGMTPSFARESESKLGLFAAAGMARRDFARGSRGDRRALDGLPGPPRPPMATPAVRGGRNAASSFELGRPRDGSGPR